MVGRRIRAVKLEKNRGDDILTLYFEGPDSIRIEAFCGQDCGMIRIGEEDSDDAA